jgi:molybdate/tungstate transport system substrate-binding protein
MKKQFDRMGSRAISAAVIVLTLFVSAILSASAGEKVIIFHAGSLTKPLEEIKKRFETANPGIDVQREAGGSTKMARMIFELNKSADIMASADYKVIDKTLIPEKADWNIRFASNQLVLCYTDQSRYAGEVNDHNWYEILGRKNVVWGHSDPNLDPCGYLLIIHVSQWGYD